MEFLQIWIGDPPAEEMKNWMRSVYQKAYERYTYTLISESNFLQDCPAIRWIPYQSYIEEMLKDKTVYRELWDCIEPDRKHHEIRSDVIRFHYLSNNQNVLYADTDVVIHELPQFDNEKIYFSQKGRWTIDIFLMFNGKNCDLFSYMLEASAKRSINHYRNNNLEIRRGWVFNIINRVNIKNRKSISQTIPEHYFTHYWCHARN